ncbi:GFA family protein [Neisseria bacilliformis]|uniref:GFA family protein n=1 Tax=Neisseria bacilliformis TaxID=267212 RepID=UPI0006694736|nr:GFA family protein [Neisseria bacilliformis]
MKAQCQCGSVTLEVKHNHEVHACHCSKCRQRTGGASFTLTAEGAPQISGAEHIGRYRSSDWGERTFCKQCGNDLYFHLLPESGMDEAWYVNAGLFAENADFSLKLQIFTDCQAPYYHLSDDTPKMTEQEFLAWVGAAE